LGIRIGSVVGIPIYLDYSWFVIFFLLAWTIGFVSMPSVYPGLSQLDYLFIGALSALLLFVSILVHELAHSVVAKRSGLKIERITLYLLGGVSQMESEPSDPSQELKMAAAGPLTSLAISVLVVVGWLFSTWLNLSPLVQAPLFYVALVNVVVAGFNLIPAFPMDGGRVLRSLLWRRNGNIVRSTVMASNIGRVFAYILVFFGMFTMIFVDLVSGVWFLLIGWFISSSATSSLRQTTIQEDLRGVSVADLMTRTVESVTPEMDLGSLSEEFIRTDHTGFPVVSGGELVGCVTLRGLKKVRKESWATTKTAEIMVPREKLVTTLAGAPATDIITSMNQRNVGRVFVMDGGKMAGIVTRSDIVKAVELKEGTLGISRGRRAFEERVSLTVEMAMNFVLEQLVDDDFAWRAESPGDLVRLMGQEAAKAPSGRQVERFTFQAVKVGTSVIRLVEIRNPSGTAEGAGGKTRRAATYTVTVSPPSQMRI
jgi:Zn-dependent protease/CBS domain-containing protein